MEPEASPPHSYPPSLSAESLYVQTDMGSGLVTRLLLLYLNDNHVGLLTLEAQVILASSSKTGRALGTRAAVLVWSLADPVAPAEVNSAQLE